VLRGLCDAVARFCTEQITPERLTAWQREPRGIDTAAWNGIAALGWFGLVEFLSFVAILAVAYVYIWRKGALEWR
jgi:hypothetical protein